MVQRPRISGCVVAMNEEDRIGDCLSSLDFCDEVLVVDSHSGDATREVSARMGARVIERDWPGHVAQKEFAVRAADHDWILSIDADERVSPELRAEILALRDAGFPECAGWRMPRASSYLGRWIRHGTWYPNLQLRLFDRRRARWAGVDPHDRVEAQGRVGRLRGELLHHPYRNLAEHLATIDRYTSIMAEELRREGRRARVVDWVMRPWARFLNSYVLRRGFLDGWRGLLIAHLAAHYVRLKWAKLYLEPASTGRAPPVRGVAAGHPPGRDA
jgi:glycosyltransferase involved in cell wall biosynthesis